jgi:hypothetical protein
MNAEWHLRVSRKEFVCQLAKEPCQDQSQANARHEAVALLFALSVCIALRDGPAVWERGVIRHAERNSLLKRWLRWTPDEDKNNTHYAE